MAYELIDQVSLVDADYETALSALDYTCQHYLHMSARDFIAAWDAGRITRKDAQQDSGIASCIEMLSFLKRAEDISDK